MLWVFVVLNFNRLQCHPRVFVSANADTLGILYAKQKKLAWLQMSNSGPAFRSTRRWWLHAGRIATHKSSLMLSTAR